MKQNCNSITSTAGLDFWEACIPNVLSNITWCDRPILIRRQLDCAFSKAISHHDNPCPKGLVLVFGSLARPEPAQDIDLIIVLAGTSEEHIYHRLRFGEWSVDLNVVNSNWLRDAWKDVEWGYWINDAHVVAATDPSLELLWRQSANRYWTPTGRTGRSADHISMAKSLIRAATLVSKLLNPLLYQFFMHEAARAITCGVLDRVGNRIFSHRTFITELTTVGSKLLPMHLIKELVCALSGKECSFDRYVEIRGAVSDFLRNDKVQLFTGYSQSLSRIDRVNALVNLAVGSAAHKTEALLRERNAEEWLPDAVSIESLNQAVTAIEVQGNHERTMKSFRLGDNVEIPRRGDIPGVRWFDLKGDRLKLVVNTGGCHTPSCVFCPLPGYGRASERKSIQDTLELILSRYSPHSLALYTDGNFLDTREIPYNERQNICTLLRKHHVEELTVESIPRFVTYESIAEMLELSAVKLTIAMGFQSYGNSYAISKLGRPDVDVLFDRAIDIIHSAGASVRLYLLTVWQGDTSVSISASDRLVQSIEWAKDREVEVISICPYRNPIEKLDIAKESSYINSLLELVASINPVESSKIEVLRDSLDSCVNDREGFI